MEIGTLRICYHWCCLVFLLLSVTLVSTQQVGGVDIQPRYEYMNRTAQMEVWDRYFQTMRGMYGEKGSSGRFLFMNCRDDLLFLQ